MNDYTNPPPRRPLVPGPSSGIAAKAVALREAKARSEVRLPEAAYNAEPTVTEHAPNEPSIRQVLRSVMTPGPVGNLAKGIAGVMSEVGTIQKTGFNKFHNYAYATLQDLLFAITPLMGKHGVVVIQNEVERTQVETRIMVTYEFSIFHTSGEIWPEKPRFTGMCIGRNSKGDYDDKAINKAHSAARKYFLLSLFQVPSGDFDDADEGPAQAKAVPEKRTIPGPDARPQKPAYQPPPPLTVEERDGPRKIALGPGAGAASWAKAFIEGIKRAQNGEELAAWDELNAAVLNKLDTEYQDLYLEIDKAVTQKTLQIAPLLAMPDAKNDTQEAMNWVAQMLADCAAYSEAEKLWNEAVAPHELEFDPADWELLMNEWRRAEIRLAPDTGEPEPPEAA